MGNVLVQIGENIALLITLSFVYSFIQRRYRVSHPLIWPLVTGGLFGIIGVATMLRPIELVPGVIFDMRFSLVVLSAIFEGPIAALITTLAILTYRVAIGGSGLAPAIGVTISIFVVGVVINRLKNRPPQYWPIGHYAVLGLVIVAFMALWILTLPDDLSLDALRTVLFPLLIGYPIGTAFVGGLLSNEIRQHEFKERLQVNEQKYRSLFEDSYDAIFVVQADSRVLDVNRQGAEMLGYSRDEILNMPVTALYVRPQERADFLNRVRKGGVVRDYHLALRKKNGEVIHALVTTSALSTTSGLAASHQSILRDVTEQMQIERELTAYRGHLEVLVQQRTAELEKANLQLKHLTKVKDEFVSNVSHELRSPITSLKIHLELLTHRPDKKQKYMQTLVRETRRLEELVEDLLYISRLDQAPALTDVTDVNLNVLINDYVTDRRPVAEQKDLNITLEMCSDLPDIRANLGQIRQVVSVLLTNAINYTPPGGAIDIRVMQKHTGGVPMVGFSVGNTGPSIPPEERSRIFDRFFRGSIALETGTAGTGLGLSIAREIVQRHRGIVELTDADGDEFGAMFIVWLPVELETLPADID